jgi:hypothetical protein
MSALCMPVWAYLSGLVDVDWAHKQKWTLLLLLLLLLLSKWCKFHSSASFLCMYLFCFPQLVLTL